MVKIQIAEIMHTNRDSKLQVSFGPDANTDVTRAFSVIEWNNPGVQPYMGQHAKVDTIRWETDAMLSTKSL